MVVTKREQPFVVIVEYDKYLEMERLLHRYSETIINWSCSVDMEHIDLKTGALVVLHSSELKELEEKYALSR